MPAINIRAIYKRDGWEGVAAVFRSVFKTYQEAAAARGGLAPLTRKKSETGDNGAVDSSPSVARVITADGRLASPGTRPRVQARLLDRETGTSDGAVKGWQTRRGGDESPAADHHSSWQSKTGANKPRTHQPSDAAIQVKRQAMKDTARDIETEDDDVPMDSFKDDVERKKALRSVMPSSEDETAERDPRKPVPPKGMSDDGASQGEEQVAKEDANYRYSGGDTDKRCENCKAFEEPSGCAKVSGIVRRVDVCDLFEARAALEAARVFRNNMRKYPR